MDKAVLTQEETLKETIRDYSLIGVERICG